MANKMTTIAWQGISIKVPEDWSLVGVSGNEKKGYYRVDSPIASAVEVRWSQAFGKKPDLLERGRTFLSTLEKNFKRNKIPYSSKIKIDKDDTVAFNWRADRTAQGRLVYCKECDRVIIIQVISDREENVSAVSPLILKSLSDHREDGWISWALYGLEFAAPRDYKIDRQQLMSGYIFMSFKSGLKTLIVQRWGLVSAILGGDSLDEWYKKDIMPDVKGYKVDIKKSEVSGHEGLEVNGKRAGIKQFIKSLAYSLTLNAKPDLFTGYVWKCDESNRLFSIRTIHSADDDIADRVRETIKCH